jgi:hypothetical protein
MTLALIIAIYFMLKIIFSLRRGVLSINFVWLWGVLGIAFLASLIFRKQIQNLSESLLT